MITDEIAGGETVMTVVAAQLYTLRDFMKTPEDIAKSLKKVSEIGYRAVQVSGVGPIDPKELRRILDGEGLEVCATHISYEAMRDRTESVIEEHNIIGCKNAGIGGLPGNFRSYEGYKTFAKEASEVAKKLAEGGISFIYHNHSFEFQRFEDGRTGIEILYGESDPAYFLGEIDTYWVQNAGADPVVWIKKLAGRMPVIHFKDMAVKGNDSIMAEVGEGNLNWPAIIEACKEAGIRWHVVEQDVCQRDPFESLAISLRNLKELGLE